MSDNMDKDIFNMDELNNLMEDMFDSGMPVNIINDKLKKKGGSLEIFAEDEAKRVSKLKEWSESDKFGRSPTPPYESRFDGVEKHNLNQLSNQTVQGIDAIVFEKDEQNSSLAGVKNVTGIEDIHDFFTVGRGQSEQQPIIDVTAIDEQIEEMKSLSEGEKRELDQEFVNDMGMDIQRLRKIAGATSAWQEIRAIKSELEDLQSHSRKLLHRFEEFIDIYVQDKIPK